MAINIELARADVETSLENPPKLHYIPASIGGDGPAKVQEYFDSYTAEQEDKTLLNALRGYPLRGKPFTLPEGCKGVIFQETQKPLSADDERSFSFAGAFDRFTYWNYDKIPSKNDPLEKALNWMELAAVLHAPLSDTNVKEEMVIKNEK
ncbi:ribonuclease H2 subunit C [Uranotaenia lowii]|uniref:ribonuclease H2 subunit C n=1 Tax=Uranotaenia lowii TaxID=190385 RepID=UPI0024792CF5|nr:ribonuclease H2 subunit C [Uranotaenia lowii]